MYIRELALSLLYWACRRTTVEKRAAAGTTGQRGGANTPTLKAGLQLQVGGAVHCREPEPGSWCRLTSGRRLCAFTYCRRRYRCLSTGMPCGTLHVQRL